MEEDTVKNKVGRPSNPVVYKNVEYNDKKYTIGKVKHNDSFVYFVIDEGDYVKIKDYSWHYTSNKYISHNITINNEPVSYTHLTLPTKRIV